MERGAIEVGTYSSSDYEHLPKVPTPNGGQRPITHRTAAFDTSLD